MPSDAEELARLNSLIQIGLRLALSTSSGRIVLAKLAANLDPRWIPSPLHASLGTALAQATAARPGPLSGSEVDRMLTSAWGVRRVSEVLETLELEPVAVTFTAQVHRAVHDGSAVAVKVLRPGVAAAFRQDLMLVDTLLAPLGGAFPGIDPGALLAEARERGLDELDFEHEATSMRRFGRALRGSPVVVPVPLGDLCEETVLVSSWLEGTPLASGVRSDSHPPDSTAAALLQFVVGGLREGMVHCDLDVDDVLLLADGQVGVVDYGAVATFDRARADDGVAAIDAYAAGDPDALGDALVRLGVIGPGHGDSALTLARTALGPLGGAEASRLDVDAVLEMLRRLEGSESSALELMLAAHLPPADLYPARGIAQLFSLIARLGATGVWRDQVRAALSAGWSG